MERLMGKAYITDGYIFITFQNEYRNFSFSSQGDGTTFKCKELMRCFDSNNLVKDNGTFIMLRNPSKGDRRRQRQRSREFENGWIVKNNVYFLNGDRFLGESENSRLTGTLNGKGTYFWRDGKRVDKLIAMRHSESRSRRSCAHVH